MPLTPTPLLATSLKAVARSFLLSLGVDHVLLDFLANVGVGALAILLAIVFVGFRIPRRSSATQLTNAVQTSVLQIPK
jgi:hypothetical protein